MMLLHGGEPLAPHDLWRAWSLDLGVIVPLAVTAALYGRGIREALQRATRAKGALEKERLAFIAGFGVLALALISPIHSAGTVLFSAHMIQHELLMAIAAPLLVIDEHRRPCESRDPYAAARLLFAELSCSHTLTRWLRSPAFAGTT